MKIELDHYYALMEFDTFKQMNYPIKRRCEHQKKLFHRIKLLYLGLIPLIFDTNTFGYEKKKKP